MYHFFSEKDKNELFQEKKIPDIDAIEEKLENLVTHTSALSKLLEDSHKVTNQFMEYAKFDGEVGFAINISHVIQFLNLQIIVPLYCRESCTYVFQSFCLFQYQWLHF